LEKDVFILIIDTLANKFAFPLLILDLNPNFDECTDSSVDCLLNILIVKEPLVMAVTKAREDA
jgi:hypothetical protein